MYRKKVPPAVQLAADLLRGVNNCAAQFNPGLHHRDKHTSAARRGLHQQHYGIRVPYRLVFEFLPPGHLEL